MVFRTCDGFVGASCAYSVSIERRSFHARGHHCSHCGIRGTLRGLKLVNRQDPAVTMVAKRIIELARTVQRDPDVLRDAVLNSFRSDAGFSGL